MTAHSTLILDCTACRDRCRADESNRTPEGYLEWTAEFRTVPDPAIPGTTMCEPLRFEDLNCPECGKPGRIWSY